MDKKIAKLRCLIQAAAALLSNIHLPNFFKGKIYQGNGKTVCVPGLNCYSCPAASGACPIGAFQSVVGSSKFNFSYYITGFFILLGVILGRFICGFLCPFGWFQDLLHKIPGKKLSYSKTETSSLPEICNPGRFCDPASYICNKSYRNGRSFLLQIYLPPGSAGRCHPPFTFQCRYPLSTWQAFYIQKHYPGYGCSTQHPVLQAFL